MNQKALLNFVERLEAITLPLSGKEAIETLEKLKRLNLYLPLFVCQGFPPQRNKKDNGEAWNFCNLIMHHAKKRNVSNHIIIAEGLRNEIRMMRGEKTVGIVFPSFIRENMDILFKYLLYLLDGDEEIENLIPEGAKAGATKIATATLGEELEKNLKFRYQGKFE